MAAWGHAETESEPNILSHGRRPEGVENKSRDHTSSTRFHVILSLCETPPPPPAEPPGARTPYQLHSKQTRAGSVSLPGIRLGEEKKGGSDGGGGKRRSMGGEA